MARSMPRKRRMVAILVLLCGVVALSALPGATATMPGRAAAAETLPYQISSDTLNDLTDVHPGDRVKVVIQGTVAGALSQISDFAYCPVPFPGTPGSDFSSAVCASPNPPDFTTNTPPTFLSDPNTRLEFTVFIPAEGDNVFPPAGPRKNELNCSPGHQCSIGFMYQYRAPSGDLTTVRDVTSLSFTVKDPEAQLGCTAEQEGKYVDALGPYRMVEAETAWARDRCGGTQAQDLDLTTMDDVTARDRFRAGEGDIFFGAGGVTSEEDPKAAAKRKAVPVPLGLNAMVLAVDGQYGGPSSFPPNKAPLPINDVKLTAKEFADLLSNPFKTASATDLLADNPQIAQVNSSILHTVKNAAYSTPEVGHSLTTRYLANRAPSDWKYPADDASFGDNRGKPIGELWRLDSLNPGGGSSLSLAADRVSLTKVVNDTFDQPCRNAFYSTGKSGCLSFVLTDAATAAYFKLPVAKLENGAGNFVAPTTQSMAAAVKDMKALPDGSLVTDPSVVDQNAYPLTFVEYAYAPAQTVVDANCQSSDKQALIKDVLGYMLTGQSDLSTGMQPLPSSLWRQANTALSKVGTETPDCAKNQDGGPAGTQPDSGPGDSGNSGNTAPSGTNTPTNTSAGAVGDHKTQPVTTAGQQNALQTAQETRIPLFAGMAALVLLVPLTALALTNGFTSGAAYGSAGRKLPPPVARAVAAVAAWLRRLWNTVMRTVRRLPLIPGGRS